MANNPGRSFPRLAYGGKSTDSNNVAVMPSTPIGLSEHLSIFGNPQPYYYSLHHLKNQLSENELHGRGGAAFPLSRKLEGYEKYRGQVVVVANGSESEYLSHKDEILMMRHPHLILDGLAILGTALDAKVGFVHIKVAKTGPQTAITAALAERKQLDPFKIEISTSAPDVGYISGTESAVISAINKQGGRPIYLPDRPISRGVRKRPTLIANVETLAHLALLARFGAGWFSSVGIGGDTGTRLLTITLPNGKYTVLEVVAGTSFDEIFGFLGVTENQVSFALLGGYFGQIVDPGKLWSLRASAAYLKDAGFSLGAGVVALANGCPVVETGRVLKYLSGESAGQCGPCYFGLPELAKAWMELASGKVNSKALARIGELCDEIIGRGACAMPDGAVLLARASLNRFRSEIVEHQGGNCSYQPMSRGLVPPQKSMAH